MILGLSGKMGSGKDAFASVLMELSKREGVTPQRLAFGDLLKAEVAQACDVTLEYINRHKPLFRPMLQWWGTDFRRALFGPNYWIERLSGRIEQSEAGLVVITDLRFPNEAAMVRRLGGLVARVRRRSHAAPAAVAGHASETALDGDGFDYVVRNYGALADLRTEALRFWEECMVPA